MSFQPDPLPTLAQATATNSSTSMLQMIVMLGVVLILAGGLIAVLSIVRRRMREESNFVPRDFSLADLRDLHREKKLTDEEFERAKAKLVSGVQSKLAKEVKPSSAGTPAREELKDAF